ncbi:MAG: GHKL domain-containing protein [Bacilli bacterium]|nr:GHKL domain-containing protein [Bacilli bacterium]
MSEVGRWFLQYFTYSRYVIEWFAMVYLFSRYFKRVQGFWVKHFIIVGVSLALIVPLTFLGRYLVTYGLEYYRYFTFGIYFLLSMPAVISVLICYDTTGSNKFFVVFSGIVLRDFCRTVFYLILLGVGTALNKADIYQMGTDNDIYLLIYYPIFAIIVLLYGYMVKKAVTQENFVSFDKRFTFILSIVVPMQVISSLVQARLQNDYPLEYGLALTFNLMASFIALSVQFLIVFVTSKTIERQALEQKHQAHLHEFSVLQENMDLINHKVHDLRHQLRAARLSEKLDPAFIEEFESSLRIYDYTFDTGNKELDLILTDTKFHSSSYNIAFTAMVDGQCISFMQPQDVVSMFSNILENAVNYEKRLTDAAKREISLKVAKKNGFVHIECENVLGEVEKDEEKQMGYHGFGVPSVKRISRKYGGVCSVSSDKGTYRVSITLPIDD